MFLNPFVLREILKQQSYVSIQDWKVACLISMRNFGILPFSLAILSLVCFSCMNSSLVAALDMITEDQQIGDGETLDSVDEKFVLGFFSPPNSTNRYVGIWYKKVPVKTIIWVANRERPLKDNTGILTINDGNLVIMDSRGGFITISFGSSSSSNTTAQLLDSGNLVLRENNGRILWQSFDYPTDAFLPGMKLGRNIKNKQNRLLTAWRSEEDPAVGIYSFGADPNGTRQFFIWQDETIYWSSGIFTRNTFSLVPPSGLRNLFNYSYVSNDDEQYFTYSLVNKSLLSRFVLQPSGQVQQLTWSEESQKFNLYWSHPRDRCDVYAPCGAFGSCSTNRSSLCKCLQGFEPVQPTDWDSNNWSDGCRRQTRLTCGVGDAFLKLRSTKYPDQLRYVEDSSQDPRKCEITCISNCSCIAYASVNKTGCLFWSGNLMGLRENYNEAGQAYGKQILFVRVAASDLDEGNSTSHDQGQKKRVWVIVVVTAALVSFLVVFFALYFWRKLQKQRGDEKRGRELFNKDDKGSDLQLFSFATIVAATENFSPANKLGQGGFGPVYKGKLPDGQEIAVKRLSKSSGQGLKEFKNEIELIAKLQHMNLVRLLGCCIQVEEKMLIYEYMPNKSLDSFLFDPAKGTKLDWGRRVHIIEGIAQGLLYLHKYSRLKVIHRDLKASNILLDGEMNPKISDFGMARMFGNNAAEANTNRIVGTYGYMSPEYAMRGIFSVKSDVFSFGVLLLEIISGQKNSSFDPLDGSLSFLGYVWELWKDGKGAELMDSVLSPSSSPTDEVVRYVNIALLCVQEKAKDRPTMVEVVSMLSSEAATLPIPNQPAFFLTRHDVGLDSTTKSSANGLTISMVDAR